MQVTPWCRTRSRWHGPSCLLRGSFKTQPRTEPADFRWIQAQSAALIEEGDSGLVARWERRCTFAVERAGAYLLAMRSGVSAAIDRRLEEAIVAWLRREWPVLRLVPSRWIRPATRPTAVRLRRSLSRITLALAAPTGIVLALLTLAP